MVFECAAIVALSHQVESVHPGISSLVAHLFWTFGSGVVDWLSLLMLPAVTISAVCVLVVVASVSTAAAACDIIGELVHHWCEHLGLFPWILDDFVLSFELAPELCS